MSYPKRGPSKPTGKKGGPRNAPNLCASCEGGTHDPETHGEIGCTKTVSWAPYDYVCLCSLARRRPIGEKAVEELDWWQEGF